MNTTFQFLKDKFKQINFGNIFLINISKLILYQNNKDNKNILLCTLHFLLYG